MRKISVTIFILFSFNGLFGQIKLGDNVNTINTSSLLELESTTKGLLFSRMNSSQMNAMTAVNGLTIYNLDSNCLFTYNGTKWTNLCATTSIPNLILTKIGTSVGLKLGTGNTVYFSIADNDSSKTNEIQTISFANDSIYLSLNGGKIGLKSLIIDTTSLSNRINQRVRYSDTASMLAPYLRDADTASLSNRINKKLAASDTISLSNRIDKRVKYADTASMLAPYLRDADTASLSKRINTNKQAIIDTASSLRNKIDAHIAADLDTDTTNEMQTLSISGQTLRISKRNSVTLPSIDTASLSNRIDKRVKYTDTASMLAPYLRDADTASLSNRINKKLAASDTISLSNRIDKRVRYTDTATMLTPYLRKGDTANMLNKYIYNANNGLTKNGKTVQLGGTLTQATTVTTSASNTLALSGLQSGSGTDSILVVNPSTGVIKRVAKGTVLDGYMKYTDTASLSNRINQRVKYTDTASMLSKYLRKGDTANMLNKYIYNANNGLTKNGKTVQLGGTLTQATTVTTSASNTLALSGLQSGSGTDSILVVNPSTGVIKRVAKGTVLNGYMKYTDTASLSNRINQRVKYTDTASMLSKYLRKGDTANMLNKYIYNANNGLTKNGKTVQLGGTLTQATTVTTSASNTLALAGLQSGSGTDSILVVNPSTGVIKRVAKGTVLNGYMKYTDTASLSNRIDKRVRYTDTSSMLTPYLRKGDTANMLNKYIYNANNGLTKNGKTVQLGGTLTQATTITTSSTNTLTLAGLQRAASTDSVLMVTSAGVVKRITSANLHTGYMKYTDTASLSNRIDKRVRYTDTSTMLTPYLRKGDTANMLSKYIYNANNGLTKNGKTVQLGGTLTQATTVTTSASNTLALAGLQSGSGTDSILVVNPSTGVIKRLAKGTVLNGYMKYTDTASLSNRIDKRVRYTDTATMLTPYLRKGDTSNMLSKYLRKGDTSAMLSKYLRKGDTANMLNKYIYNANNGLTKNGKTVQLGGTLTQATTVTTSASNTLALAGLQSGLVTDSVLVVNASTGVIKRVSPKRLETITKLDSLGSGKYKFTSENNTVTSFLASPIKAYGKVSSAGSASKIFGASVSRTAAGTYSITFTTAMPDANYIIQLAIKDMNGVGFDDPSITYTNQTTAGFTVKTSDNDNGTSAAADTDLEFMFTVIAY